jgi:hypothetical protein
LLGWNPTIPLREGLEKTVAYFAERINAEVPEKVRRQKG